MPTQTKRNIYFEEDEMGKPLETNIEKRFKAWKGDPAKLEKDWKQTQLESNHLKNQIAILQKERLQLIADKKQAELNLTNEINNHQTTKADFQIKTKSHEAFVNKLGQEVANSRRYEKVIRRETDNLENKCKSSHGVLKGWNANQIRKWLKDIEPFFNQVYLPETYILINEGFSLWAKTKDVIPTKEQETQTDLTPREVETLATSKSPYQRALAKIYLLGTGLVLGGAIQAIWSNFTLPSSVIDNLPILPPSPSNSISWTTLTSTTTAPLSTITWTLPPITETKTITASPITTTITNELTTSQTSTLTKYLTSTETIITPTTIIWTPDPITSTSTITWTPPIETSTVTTTLTKTDTSIINNYLTTTAPALTITSPITITFTPNPSTSTSTITWTPIPSTTTIIKSPITTTLITTSTITEIITTTAKAFKKLEEGVKTYNKHIESGKTTSKIQNIATNTPIEINRKDWIQWEELKKWHASFVRQGTNLSYEMFWLFLIMIQTLSMSIITVSAYLVTSNVISWPNEPEFWWIRGQGLTGDWINNSRIITYQLTDITDINILFELNLPLGLIGKIIWENLSVETVSNFVSAYFDRGTEAKAGANFHITPINSSNGSPFWYRMFDNGSITASSSKWSLNDENLPFKNAGMKFYCSDDFLRKVEADWGWPKLFYYFVVPNHPTGTSEWDFDYQKFPKFITCDDEDRGATSSSSGTDSSMLYPKWLKGDSFKEKYPFFYDGMPVREFFDKYEKHKGR